MADYTSTQDGDWHSAATWGGAGVPTSTDTVTISDGHTVTISEEVIREAATTLNGTAKLTLNASLFVYGDWTDNANSQVELTASNEEFDIQDATVNSAVIISAQYGTYLPYGAVDQKGQLTISGTEAELYLTDDTILNCASPIKLTGTGAGVYSGIDVSGDNEIWGGVDADGSETVATVESGATLTLRLDVDGDLDLGTDGSGGPADWSDVMVSFEGTDTESRPTVVRDMNVYGFTNAEAGTYINFDNNDLTVHEGGLNVTNASSVTSLARVTFAADTTTCQHNLSSYPIGRVVVNAAVTLSGYLRCRALDGSGTLDLNSTTMIMYPDTADFWDFSGTVLNTGGGADGFIQLRGSGVSNASSIDAGAAENWQQAFDDSQFQYPGGLACDGALILKGSSPQVAHADMDGGDLEVGSIELGDTAADRLGRLDLGEGRHVVTGSIARAGSGTQVLNFESCRLECGGDITLAGIEVDWGNAVIVMTGNGKTIDGTGAVSHAVSGTPVIVDDGNGTPTTITNLDYDGSSGPILAVNCTDGGGNGAGVIFRGTGEIAMRGAGF